MDVGLPLKRYTPTPLTTFEHKMEKTNRPQSRILVRSCKFCHRLYEQVNPAFGGRPTDFCLDIHRKMHHSRTRKDKKVVPIVAPEETE